MYKAKFISKDLFQSSPEINNEISNIIIMKHHESSARLVYVWSASSGMQYPTEPNDALTMLLLPITQV